MTQTFSVRCQNCGSPLQVNDGLRYVTCGYCKSELQLVKDASETIHTELLAKLNTNTESLERSLKVLEIQKEIERLDRDRSQGFTPEGRQLPPHNSLALTMLVSFAAIGFGIGGITFCRAIEASFIYELLAMAFIGLVIIQTVRDTIAWHKRLEADRNYETRRARLVSQIQQDEKHF